MADPEGDRSPLLPVAGLALLAAVASSTPEGRARARERQKPFAAFVGLLTLLLVAAILLWPDRKAAPQPSLDAPDEAEAAAPLPPPAWPSAGLPAGTLPLDLRQGQSATDDAASSQSY